MAKYREKEMLKRYFIGAAHDMMKYFPFSMWDYALNHKYKSIPDKRFVEAKNAVLPIMENMRILITQKVDDNFESPEFREAAQRLKRNVSVFVRNLREFSKSKECPLEFRSKIKEWEPATRMLIPLADVFIHGRPMLRRSRLRVRDVVEELKSYGEGGMKYEATDSGVQQLFRVKGDPVAYVDPMHFRRAAFNIFHDAITHSRGEAVVVDAGRKGNRLVFGTTNVGRRLPKEVAAKIGNEPYSTSVGEGLHGFGKVAAKDVVLAHGGTFRARNTKQGFRISFSVPLKQRQRRRMVA